MLKPTRFINEIRWLECHNVSGQAVPPGAVVRVTGTDTNGFITINQPNADSLANCLVSGPLGIVKDGIGLCTAEGPVNATYDSAGGSPTLNDAWGTTASSWKLVKGKTGFQIIGNVDATGHMVLVNRSAPAGGPSASLTVREKDGSPSIANVQILTFDQATGLSVSTTATATEASVKNPFLFDTSVFSDQSNQAPAPFPTPPAGSHYTFLTPQAPQGSPATAPTLVTVRGILQIDGIGSLRSDGLPGNAALLIPATEFTIYAQDNIIAGHVNRMLSFVYIKNDFTYPQGESNYTRLLCNGMIVARTGFAVSGNVFTTTTKDPLRFGTAGFWSQVEPPGGIVTGGTPAS